MKFYQAHKDSLNDRQDKMIVCIFKEGFNGFAGGLSAKNYISITGCSKATATRDLQDLCHKNILNMQGSLKNSRYYLRFNQ